MGETAEKLEPTLGAEPQVFDSTMRTPRQIGTLERVQRRELNEDSAAIR